MTLSCDGPQVGSVEDPMAIELGPMQIETIPHAEDRSPVDQARHTIRCAVQSVLLRERDDLVRQVEYLEDRLRKIREEQAHTLSVRCDGCRAVLTVASSQESERQGGIALGLLNLGIAMRWRFAPSTSAHLTALAGEIYSARMSGVRTPGISDADHCPSCERKAAKP